MNKKIIESSAGDAPVSYDMYDDNSVDVLCPKCLQKRPLVGKAAESFLKWHKTNKDYVCAFCYGSENSTKVDGVQDNIRFAQAFNLSVALMSAVKFESDDDEKLKATIKEWQSWFYEQLKRQ